MLIRIDNNVPPTRRPSAGRFPKKTDCKTVAKLENLMFGKIGISFRKFAENFLMNDKTEKQILKD